MAAITRADALAARVHALVPPQVVVEVRRDARWWVQVSWNGPRDQAAAAQVVAELDAAGLKLLPRSPEPADDMADRLSAGEPLEVVDH